MSRVTKDCHYPYFDNQQNSKESLNQEGRAPRINVVNLDKLTRQSPYNNNYTGNESYHTPLRSVDNNLFYNNPSTSRDNSFKPQRRLYEQRNEVAHNSSRYQDVTSTHGGLGRHPSDSPYTERHVRSEHQNLIDHDYDYSVQATNENYVKSRATLSKSTSHDNNKRTPHQLNPVVSSAHSNSEINPPRSAAQAINRNTDQASDQNQIDERNANFSINQELDVEAVIEI